MIRLFNRYWAAPAMVSLIVEGLLLGSAVPLATQLRLGVGPGELPPRGTVLLESLLFMAVGLLALYATGLYDFGERLSPRELMIRLLRTFWVGAVASWAVYFLVPTVEVGRGVFALALVFGSGFVLAWRVLLGWILRSEGFAERVLIVGADEKAIDIARETLLRKHLGYRVVGFLDDDPRLQGVSILNPRVIGTTAQACELALQHGATRVVVAAMDYRGRLSMDALLKCKTNGIRVQEGSSYYEQITGKIMVEGLRKSWLIFSDGFVVSRGTLFAKRLLDILVAGVGLVLALPFMLLVALAVRLDSPGPVFFRQDRVGRGGREFTLWKFRSMRTDAEAGGARWAVQGDPRVTRVGRFIRKTRLDELPQLWNVLAGDMSLVGPRPERRMFVEQLKEVCPWYEQRLVVRPGLTGWAQIKAPYASSFEESIEKLKFDLFYIKNLSLFLDVSILLSTARIVLLGRGAR
ncbi:MAG TPA: TIGR03013 family XrtA/PEP-CTERM system glycosyltransferase [Thermoanaerobaculia bacterium]|jgi:sugar transferase (PEP-CTERM system associated)|nr:TIGR03013 family XrtA/PEP-CTERM system glycosyltransferase [Thermoanaerobaculia bacterium]